ncbi:MAG: DUF4926 domain-containing protein [Bacteroidota bacterium]
MEEKINLLKTVALLKPIPEKGLRKGQVGTVVEILAEDVFEVEFCDRQGRTIAMLPIKEKDLLLLKYELEMA